jgi:IS5 family transposase
LKEHRTFASLAWAGKKKQTKRDKFLSEMDRVVPWSVLVGLIEPHYPKAGNGRRPMPLERMVRLYFLQQWYGLSDPGMEEALYDIESVRRFVGIELGEEEIPDETTILNFRHLLEKQAWFWKLGLSLIRAGISAAIADLISAGFIPAARCNDWNDSF